MTTKTKCQETKNLCKTAWFRQKMKIFLRSQKKGICKSCNGKYSNNLLCRLCGCISGVGSSTISPCKKFKDFLKSLVILPSFGRKDKIYNCTRLNNIGYDRRHNKDIKIVFITNPLSLFLKTIHKQHHLNTLSKDKVA